jgi:uncharacterized membrane protein (UPF0136 family)
MRNLSRLAAAVLGAAVFVLALYILGWRARSVEHVVRGVLLAVSAALLVAAALRAWRRNEPVNLVMIAISCLLGIISTVIGLVY